MGAARYEAQLELLENAMTFALDHHAPEVAVISEVDFFKPIENGGLYIYREPGDENAIARMIAKSKHLSILAAPMGAGKTTILRKALRQYAPEENRHYIADFKKLQGKLYAKKGLDDYWPDRIQNVLKEDLANIFFRNNSELRNRYTFQALKYFFVNRYIQTKLRYQTKAKKKEMTDNEVWENLRIDSETLNEQGAHIDENISLAEMVRALKLTLGVKHFCLILDNIDRLNIDLQSYVLGVAVDIHRGGEGHFRTVVAVRKKNIMRYQEEGMGNDVIQIKALSTGTTEKARVYPIGEESAGNLPSDTFIATLLRQRHSYAEQVAKTNAGEESDFWKLFGNLRERVTTRFIEERLFNLSNHSITQMLNLNLEFTKYIFQLIGNDNIAIKDNAPDLTQSQLMSYLYRWFSRASDINHQLLSDTVENYARFDPTQPLESLDCDLEHVILAWLVNFNGHRNRTRDLVTAFQSIGATEASLCDKLFKLYSRDPEQRYVELGDAEVRITAEDVAKRKDIRVTITPLGREFIEFIITKFEFLYESLAGLHPPLDNVPQGIPIPTKATYTKKVDIVKTHLARMAEVHTATLNSIRERFTRPNLDWEEYYRNNFCLKGQLILERIMQSHLRHLALVDSQNIETYRQIYISILKDYLKNVHSKRSAETLLSLAVLRS